MTAPALPRTHLAEPGHGQPIPGMGRPVSVRVRCCICEQSTDYHARELVTVGDDGVARVEVDEAGVPLLSSDPWKTATYVGYRLLADGRIVCGDVCAREARHPANPYSVDASRNPQDTRLNYGDPQRGDPLRRAITYRCARAACGGVHVVHQSRADARTPWADPLVDLERLGWLRTADAQLYCGRECAHRAHGPAMPALAPVVTHPDAHLAQVADRALQRRTLDPNPAPPALKALFGDTPEPQPPAPKPTRRGAR